MYLHILHCHLNTIVIILTMIATSHAGVSFISKMIDSGLLLTNFSLFYLCVFFLQQKVIYYLSILLQDPIEPHVVSEVVPLFQVSPNLRSLIFLAWKHTLVFPCWAVNQSHLIVFDISSLGEMHRHVIISVANTCCIMYSLSSSFDCGLFLPKFQAVLQSTASYVILFSTQCPETSLCLNLKFTDLQ